MPYHSIDMKGTGDRLRKIIRESGYSVKQVQEYLHLSCPQPIYRWFKGQILPSLDHAFALSKLLDIHMEDLLVANNNQCSEEMEYLDNVQARRLWVYYNKIKQAA